MNSYLVWSCW